MIDPAVERQYADCQTLLDLWRQFHEFFSMAVKGDNLTHENEEAFLDLKSQIAMLHDSFMEALTRDHNIGQEVLGIISRTITLKHLNRQSVADIKKMEIEWHESYLLLNDTIGYLEEKRSELATMSAGQLRASKAAGVAFQRFNNFFGSLYFKLGVALGVVLFATVGVQTLGIFDYNSLGRQQWAQEPYRMGKAVYRSVIDQDSPWPTIMPTDKDRKPHSGWPGGVSAPTVVNDDKADVIGEIGRLVPNIGNSLNKATEYRKEEVSKGMEGKIFFHTFLLPDAASARDAEKAWNDAMSSVGQSLGKWVFVRNVNVVTLLNGENSGFLNSMKIDVYQQK